MKPRTISVAAVALASSLLLGTSHIGGVHADDRHDRACSNKTLKGSYGFYRTGNTTVGMNPGPLAAVGILFFDGEGNWIVTQKIIRNGDITLPDSTFSGTYE